MKRLGSISLMGAECVVFYAWQVLANAVAGRIFIFYSWSLAALTFCVGLLGLAGAALMKSRVPSKREGRISKFFGWLLLIVRFTAMVAVSCEWLAAVTLLGNLLCRFAMAVYQDLPEKV